MNFPEEMSRVLAERAKHGGGEANDRKHFRDTWLILHHHSKDTLPETASPDRAASHISPTLQEPLGSLLDWTSRKTAYAEDLALRASESSFWMFMGTGS